LEGQLARRWVSWLVSETARACLRGLWEQLWWETRWETQLERLWETR
jgi:hypothetical protein